MTIMRSWWILPSFICINFRIIRKPNTFFFLLLLFIQNRLLSSLHLPFPWQIHPGYKTLFSLADFLQIDWGCHQSSYIFAVLALFLACSLVTFSSKNLSNFMPFSPAIPMIVFSVNTLYQYFVIQLVMFFPTARSGYFEVTRQNRLAGSQRVTVPCYPRMLTENRRYSKA